MDDKGSNFEFDLIDLNKVDDQAYTFKPLKETLNKYKYVCVYIY